MPPFCKPVGACSPSFCAIQRSTGLLHRKRSSVPSVRPMPRGKHGNSTTQAYDEARMGSRKKNLVMMQGNVTILSCMVARTPGSADTYTHQILGSKPVTKPSGPHSVIAGAPAQPMTRPGMEWSYVRKSRLDSRRIRYEKGSSPRCVHMCEESRTGARFGQLVARVYCR